MSVLLSNLTAVILLLINISVVVYAPYANEGNYHHHHHQGHLPHTTTRVIDATHAEGEPVFTTVLTTEDGTKRNLILHVRENEMKDLCNQYNWQIPPNTPNFDAVHNMGQPMMGHDQPAAYEFSDASHPGIHTPLAWQQNPVPDAEPHAPNILEYVAKYSTLEEVVHEQHAILGQLKQLTSSSPDITQRILTATERTVNVSVVIDIAKHINLLQIDGSWGEHFATVSKQINELLGSMLILDAISQTIQHSPVSIPQQQHGIIQRISERLTQESHEGKITQESHELCNKLIVEILSKTIKTPLNAQEVQDFCNNIEGYIGTTETENVAGLLEELRKSIADVE